LPEKQAAIEKVCDMRLMAALASGSEAAMRGALRMARTYGAEHTSAYVATYKEQQRIYGQMLSKKLEEQLVTAGSEDDINWLWAIYRTAMKHDLKDLAQETFQVGKATIGVKKEARDIEELQSVRTIAEDCGWTELAYAACNAMQEVNLLKALDAGVAEESIPKVRGVEHQARESGFLDIAQTAKQKTKELADAITKGMGLPSEWDVVMDMSGLSADKLLKKSEESDTVLIERIQQLVDETFTGWGPLGKMTRTRDRAKEPIAERLEVQSVVYVQNTEGFINYRARRTKIQEEMPIGARRTWDIKTNRVKLEGLPRHRTNPVDPCINEFYLWHGTTPQAAAKITDAEFDLKRVGSSYGCLFGPGIYFAESSMKADEYTRKDRRGWFPLILCRVVCGHINYCDAYDPVKISKELEASCKPGGGYHSVLGDREKVRGTFRELIVFDNHQVYPEYIVWYTRKDPK
jgi:hypothetical protein